MSGSSGRPDETDVHGLVRSMHDDAARDANPGVASVRPLGTTRLELRLLVRDVLRKLDVQRDHSVLEIGCGVGLIGLPITQRARRYVGVDFAEIALGVFGRRLAAEELDDRATLHSVDFIAAPSEDVESLGRFDRVLAYAVLHFVSSDEEGQTFVSRALTAVEPGGRALFGNLPLADLEEAPRSRSGSRRQQFRHKLAVIGAALGPRYPNGLGVAVPRRMQVASLVFEQVRLWLRPVIKGARVVPASMPPGTTLKLSRDVLESWIENAPVDAHHQWLAPGTMTPLAHGRADLLVIRDAGVAATVSSAQGVSRV